MSDYEKICDQIFRRPFDPTGTDNALAARLLAAGIIAAENDEQILDIVQTVGNAVCPANQGIVMMTAYAIVAKER